MAGRFPAENIGLHETRAGEIIESGVLLRCLYAPLVKIASKDLPCAKQFGGQGQNSRTASEVNHRPLSAGGTERRGCLHEQLETPGRRGMVSCSEGHAAWNQQRKSFAGRPLCLEKLPVAVDAELARNTERISDFRSGGLPSRRVKGTYGAAECRLQFFGGGRVGVKIETDRAGSGEFLDDQVLLSREPQPLDPGVLPFQGGDTVPEVGIHSKELVAGSWKRGKRH